MIDKNNRYCQVLMKPDDYELLRRFAKMRGISHSQLLREIVLKYLPLEVDLYLDKLEAKYET